MRALKKVEPYWDRELSKVEAAEMEFELVEIRPEDVDTKYITGAAWQRPVQKAFVKEIAKGYARHNFVAPICVVEIDGLKHVLDGQHRIHGIKEHGKPKVVPVISYIGLTEPQARDLFLLFAMSRKVTTHNRLNALRENSDAFEIYDGNFVEGVKLVFKPVGVGGRRLTQLPWYSFLVAQLAVEGKIAGPIRDSKSIIAAWTSGTGVKAMRTAKKLVESLVDTGCAKPVYFNALAIRAFYELILENGWREVNKRLHRYHDAVKLEALRSSAEGNLIQVRRAVLAALNKRGKKDLLRLPEYVVEFERTRPQLDR